MRDQVRASRGMLLAVLFVGCGATTGAGAPATGAIDEAAARCSGVHEDCGSFQVVDLGERASAALCGFVWVGSLTDREPLGKVEIVVRNVVTGELSCVATTADGAFDLPGLSAGDYEVQGCLYGFDELRFRLTVEPTSEAEGLDIYLTPSESGAGEPRVLEVSGGGCKGDRASG